MLKIFTSQYNYRGPDRLDITIKGKDPTGVLYAPTWNLLMRYKESKISKEEYTNEYFRLMRERFSNDKDKFLNILVKPRLVFVCFEKPEENFCHRYMLANILVNFGAEYAGELNADGTYWGMPDLNVFTLNEEGF